MLQSTIDKLKEEGIEVILVDGYNKGTMESMMFDKAERYYLSMRDIHTEFTNLDEYKSRNSQNPKKHKHIYKEYKTKISEGLYRSDMDL